MQKNILISLLPATVLVQLDWITPEEVTVPQAVEMEAFLARLAPGHLRLPPDTSTIERVSVPWESLAPLSLVHPLMVFPFLAPSTTWHIMHAKSNAVGMT